MSTVSNNKNRIITICALGLMFFLFWAFVRLEIFAPNIFIFIAECVFFLVIYALTLFRIPRIVPTVLLIAGCVAKCIINANLPGARELDFLFPVTYFLAFLFYISQLCRSENRESVLAKILEWGFIIISSGFFGVIAFFAFRNGVRIAQRNIYNIFIFALVGVIYLIISFLFKNKTQSKKKKKKKQTDEYKTMRITFKFAFIPIFTSCLLLILDSDYCLIHVVPVLWGVNLILLYEQGHPLVHAFYDGIYEKLNSAANR